jgi:hypothetical protein
MEQAAGRAARAADSPANRAEHVSRRDEHAGRAACRSARHHQRRYRQGDDAARFRRSRAHGPGTHGTEGDGCLSDPLGEQSRRDVFRVNISRIERADAVFTYIDRSAAYGSAFEVGHSRALGKPIFVGFSPRMRRTRDDMWFAAQAGLGSAAGHRGKVEDL